MGDVGSEHRVSPRGMSLMLLSPSFSDNKVSGALSKDGSRGSLGNCGVDAETQKWVRDGVRDEVIDWWLIHESKGEEVSQCLIY